MDLGEWIEYANRQCAQGAAVLSFGSDVWTRDVSREELDILAFASEVGEISLRTDASFSCPVLMVGDLEIFPGGTDYDRMVQWGAFESLCLRGVLQPSTSGSYVVGEAGVIKGRRVAAQRRSQTV
jgi:hypothetical protein